jgi:alginate export protein
MYGFFYFIGVPKMPVVKKMPRAIAAVLLSGVAMSAASQESTADDISSMVTNGKATLDFRYRYEFVDQDGKPKDAKASTLRSRLTLASASYKGYSFLTEFDNVSHIGDDKYNSTANGNTEYPVVADPKGTAVNQAWLKYTWDELSGAYGRQRINHGSQRFVGGVGWRQNEQTYDGFRAEWGAASSVKLDYAYVYNVNRIFGPDDGPVQPASLRGDNHFARLDWTIAEGHTVSGFGYGIEIDEAFDYAPGKSVDNSSNTFGLEYAGKFGPVSAKAAYASQSDAGDSNLDYDADYYMLEGAVGFSGLTAKLGYEVLGGDNGVGFKTPFATLHKFQGWADMFLTTPGDGVEDIYVGLTGKVGPVKLGGFYHDFQAEDSSADFGSELDLVATWPVNKSLSLQFKYADFSTDNKARYADTTKAWLMVSFKI